VVRTDRIGDVVLATPLVRALRRTFPDAFLAALVRPYARDVLVGNPHLNAILTDDPRGADAGRRGFWRKVRELRRHRFDTALLLLPTERAAWQLFWAAIPRRIGVGRKFYEVVTGMGSVSRRGYVPLRHEADYCLDLGRAIGVRAGNSAADLATEVFLTSAERDAARRELAGVRDSDFVIGIHAGSGGSSPNWTAERWIELARTVLATSDDGVRVLLTGEAQIPPVPRTAGLVDRRAARPLRALMADLARCDLVVAPSTGPLHVAAALGVPTIGLFCPLPACSPELWGPRGNDARVILPPPGCCPRGTCPRDPKQCRFESIDVESVATVVGDAVARLRRGARLGGTVAPARVGPAATA
jgi:heptosyltransferase-2